MLHTSRIILTETEYVIKYLKYVAEVVNLDPFYDATNPNLYFFLELTSRLNLGCRIH